MKTSLFYRIFCKFAENLLLDLSSATFLAGNSKMQYNSDRGSHLNDCLIRLDVPRSGMVEQTLVR
jgi:hypothetical protein